MRGAEWREERAAVRDAELALYRRGAGRAFYWGHGLTSSSVQEARVGLKPWDAAPDGWEVIRYDARGHGASTGAADAAVYRWPELAADLLALADRLGHDRFVAGGASMGTAVSLSAAVGRAGARPRPGPHDPPDRVGDARDAIRQVPGERGSRGAGRYRSARREPSSRARRSRSSRGSSTARRWRARAPRRSTSASCRRSCAARRLPICRSPRRSRSFPQPVLILAWRGDEGHPLSSAEALARLLPQSELLVADRLADLAAWPKRVAKFLDEIGARA